MTPHFHSPKFMDQVLLARGLANYARSASDGFEGSVTIYELYTTSVQAAIQINVGEREADRKTRKICGILNQSRDFIKN